MTTEHTPAPPAPPAPPSRRSGQRGAHRPSSAHAARRKAREIALQGLYIWLVSGDDAGAVDAHMREQEGFGDTDAAHFDAVLHGCIAEAASLDTALQKHLDRPSRALSPVEHAALLIGAWELANCIEIPYRVVINEAVELAKSFGGTDGHKYVNGVLDRTAGDLRPVEVQAARAERAAKAARANPSPEG